jgi:ABC-type multidrug transport system fused ATPase/permease subunit
MYPHWRKTLLLAALLVGSTGLELLTPQIVRRFLENALQGGPPRVLAEAALLYAGTGLLQQVGAVAAAYIARDVGWRATNRLRADLARHCLHLDLGFHYARTPGELIERVAGDVARLAGFFSTLAVRIGGNALVVAGVLVLLTLQDWRFGLGLGLLVLATAGAYYAMRRLPARFWEGERRAFAALTGFLEERLGGREDLRASGATGYVMARLHPLLGGLVRESRKAWTLGGVLYFAFQGYRAGGAALAFGLGGWLVSRGAMDVAALYVVFRYVELAVWPIYHITSQIEDFQRASASVHRVRELLGRRSAIPAIAPRAPLPLPAGPLAVEFRGVTFTYPAYGPEGAVGSSLSATAHPPLPLGEGWGEGAAHPQSQPPVAPEAAAGTPAASPGSRPALDGVSFRIEPGRVLGVLGRTGSGKTTLSRLLFRFYDPAAGSVSLGGVDLRRAALADVRRRVGLVTQEVQLFHASVRDNLTLFDTGVPDARILAALRDLGLEGWYRALPEGLDTPLPGAGLSAGEAQLLAFARVFLRDPDVLVLDEASSRLDPATERLIDAATQRLLRRRGIGVGSHTPEGRRTGIVIAHRLATVRRVDDVLVLEDGRVVEHGPRAALAAEPRSRFSALLRAAVGAPDAADLTEVLT